MKWENRGVKHNLNNEEILNIGYIYGKTDKFKEADKNGKTKMAGFDLDSTLIKTKSGKKFPKNEDDWEILYSTVQKELKKLVKNDHSIVIITNQSGIGDNDEKTNSFKRKIEKIADELKVEFCIYILINKDIYRKPYPTLLNEMNIDKTNSFYCGDAAGRKNDFSDSDLKFAVNGNIRFYTPEQIFSIEDKKREYTVDYPIKCVDDKNTKNNITIDSKKNQLEMAIMVGFPGSGKSYLSKKIRDHNPKLNYIILNLDTLKTSAAFKKELNKNVVLKKNIMIDNTNLDKKTRKELIELGKSNGYTIRCFLVNIDINRCKHNNYYRYYKNYQESKLVPDLVYNIMKKKYEVPDKDEGIDDLRVLEPEVINDPDYHMYLLT